MTRQSTIERAARIQKDGPTVIGRFHVDGEPVDFPLAEADVDVDVRFWQGVLSGYGVGKGDRVVVSAFAYEFPWFQPARMAVAQLGASYSNVEQWGWDARRLEMFVRRVSPRVVLGLGKENVEGLSNIVEPAERLGPVPTLLARPDAVDPLDDAGLSPAGLVVKLGPAVGVGLADGSGIAFDESQWEFGSEGGELTISTRGSRAASFAAQRTGVRGTVEQTPAGARLVLADS